jgi:hypothetical protein
MATHNQLLTEARRADDAWQAELVRQFGKKAGDIRYTEEGKGVEGSELRRLYEAKRETNDAYGAFMMSTEACGY